MKRNEKTSNAVAKIAGRVLATKTTFRRICLFNRDYKEGEDAWTWIKWSDIRALAASCLTQAPSKPKRKVGAWRVRNPRGLKKARRK